MKECSFILELNTEMPCWYYDKKDLKVTPSIQDGLSFEMERRYRKEGARFIMKCGTAMGLGHNTVATGVVYFHRFYMFHSFKTFPRYVTSCCCLFLAGKVEETPKKCRDIIKTARSLLAGDKFYSFGEDPKEEVMTLERILLQTIKFDLQVEHPYGFLVKYAKCLKGDQGKLQKMVQMAWNFVNDSLSTTVCLQWEPEIIAVAMIHLASKLSKFTVVDWVGRVSQHLRWWDMFVGDITMEILEDICHQVLDLYQQPNHEGESSPPQQPPSKSSPPPKRSSTPPPSVKNSPIPSSNALSKNTVADDKMMEGNPIPKLVPPESIHYIYPSGYGPVFPHASHFPPIQSTAPPPPVPPVYGTQYPPPPPPPSQMPSRYPPPMSGHPVQPPPAHHQPAYYPSHGRPPYYPPPNQQRP